MKYGQEKKSNFQISLFDKNRNWGQTNTKEGGDFDGAREFFEKKILL